MSKGPFCTSTNVLKQIPPKSRPTISVVIQAMKVLQECKIGTFKEEKVFYKPLPKDENKDELTGVIGAE